MKRNVANLTRNCKKENERLTESSLVYPLWLPNVWIDCFMLVLTGYLKEPLGVTA